MPNRFKDWFRQAERDLKQAENAKKAGLHEWACFAAQQSGEKAVKALHLFFGQEAWGYVITRLLDELPNQISVPDKLLEKARTLDNHYIPSRYPNSHPAGPPFEHYGPLQSKEAVRYAGEILEFVRAEMAGSL